MSILLCVSLLASYIITPASAYEGTGDKTFSVSQSITIGGVSREITAKISYPAFATTDPESQPTTDDGTASENTTGTSHPASKKTVSVTFQTNGGSAVQSATVPIGGRLQNVPTPVKDNYAFTGWYTDKALTKEFYSDSPIKRDTTLYAAYKARDNNLKQYEDPEKYFEDCDPNISFSFVSPIPLTASNLSDYVELTSYAGDIPALNVSAIGGVYTVTPAAPYTAGGHYQLALKNDKLAFSGQSGKIRRISFRIHAEEVENVKLKDSIIYVLWSDVDRVSDGVYSVPSDTYRISTGDVVCFWDGKFDSSTLMCSVKLAAQIQGDGQNGPSTLLYTEDSSPSDVLDQVDVFTTQDIPVSKFLKNADTDKIAQAAKNSAGTQKLTKILAETLSKSPSVKALAASEGSTAQGFLPVQENDDAYGISVENLVQGLSVTATIGTANNDNFYNSEPNQWVVLTLKFNYNVVIKDKVEVNASFVVKEYMKSSMIGFIKWDGGNLPFDIAQNTYSQTTVSLSVLIRSKDTSDSDYLDITEEIENLTNQDSSDDADPAGILRDVLGTKGDDIELLNVNLFTQVIDIIPDVPVFQVNIEVNFVVKVNFAAGISAGTTVMAAKQVGFYGNVHDGVSSYELSLGGDNRYSFDLYCAGYLGLKAGLQLSLSFSAFGLKDVGEVGISAEIGAYMDLYGFVHVNISKLSQASSSPNVSLQGGLYMEVGLYGEIDLFAKSDLFMVKAKFTVVQIKVPLFSLGDRYVLLKYADTGGSFLLHSESYPLSTSTGLLDAVYIDLTTGETVTGGYTDASKFYIRFSSPYFSDDSNTIKVLKDRFGQGYSPIIPVQTKRLEAKAYIYYLGSSLAFSNSKDGYAVKTIDLTWIDSSIDISQYSDLKTVKATYVLDFGGNKTVLSERQVLFAEIPGSMDLSQYERNGLVTYENDFNQPITRDTVYAIHVTPYQRLISFITY
jgi:uncharacterized repeat protein (TIGR02543 family)